MYQNASGSIAAIAAILFRANIICRYGNLSVAQIEKRSETRTKVANFALKMCVKFLKWGKTCKHVGGNFLQEVSPRKHYVKEAYAQEVFPRKTKERRIMKKILLLLLSCCMLFGYTVTFSSCASKAPDVEEIYDRAVELIEASYEINTVIYGAGLPVYRADSEYAKFTYLYFGSPYAGKYEIVTEYSKFSGVDEWKAAASKVYSADYLNEVLIPYLFEGYMTSNGIGGAAMFEARYLEEDGKFYQLANEENDLLGDSGMRIYDYSTMRVVKPSTDEICFLEIDSWLENSPDRILKNEIRLVLRDGEWFLDSFTG